MWNLVIGTDNTDSIYDLLEEKDLLEDLPVGHLVSHLVTMLEYPERQSFGCGKVGGLKEISLTCVYASMWDVEMRMSQYGYTWAVAHQRQTSGVSSHL